MTFFPGTASRMKTLRRMAVLALALHSAMLFGIRWEIPPGSMPPAAKTQGIAIDLEQAPARKEERPAPEHAPPAVPVSPPQAEPVSSPIPDSTVKAAPERARPRKPLPPQITAAAGTDKKPAAAGAGRAAPPADSMQASSQATASSHTASGPEPLASHANPRPVYPELARRRGQEGLVQLLAHVDDKGGLLELAVAKSSGFPLLDEAALKAVRKWRFRPGMAYGRPVGGTVVIPVEFLLTF